MSRSIPLDDCEQISDCFEADVLLTFSEDVIAALLVGTAIFVNLAFGRAAFEQELSVVLILIVM